MMKIAVMGTGYVGLGASIGAHDPVGLKNAARVFEIVVAEWQSIRQLDLHRLRRAMRSPIVVELRNAFGRGAAQAAGFQVTSIGCPAPLRPTAPINEHRPAVAGEKML